MSQTPSSQPLRPISFDDCLQHMLEKTFPLRPADYGTKYPKWPGAVGLELEALPVRVGENPPGLISLLKPNGLVEILKELACEQGWEWENSPEGLPLRVLMEVGDNLSFEPGGQLEVSTQPYPCLSEANKRLEWVQSLLDKQLAKYGICLVQQGINPWYGVDGVGLQMPKKRYKAMNDHFAEISPFGQSMMRLTSTVQVNLDFGPTEETLVNRYLGSNLIAPVAQAIFANSSFLDGAPGPVEGYRSRIWRFADPSRTGFPNLKNAFDKRTKEACAKAYLEFAMDARVVFLEGMDYHRPKPPVTFRQWQEQGYQGTKPSQKDWEVHLSLLFPEVRARGFLELRSIDCQSRPWQIVPAAFYVGLLYDPNSLQKVLDLMWDFKGKLALLWQGAERGLYDPLIRQLASSLMELAAQGLGRLPPCFSGEGVQDQLGKYRKTFVEKGTTPGGLLQSYFRNSGEKILTVDVLQAVDQGSDQK